MPVVWKRLQSIAMQSCAHGSVSVPHGAAMVGVKCWRSKDQPGLTADCHGFSVSRSLFWKIHGNMKLRWGGGDAASADHVLWALRNVRGEATCRLGPPVSRQAIGHPRQEHETIKAWQAPCTEECQSARWRQAGGSLGLASLHGEFALRRIVSCQLSVSVGDVCVEQLLVSVGSLDNSQVRAHNGLG